MVTKLAEFIMTCGLIYVLGILVGYFATEIHEWRNKE